MTSNDQQITFSDFAGANSLNMTATSMFFNEKTYNKNIQYGGLETTSAGAPIFDDSQACFSYGQILEEYTRFFDLDSKIRGVKENSFKDKSSDHSTADDYTSNSSARNTELHGSNICVKVSLDTLQAFTGVQKCLTYSRLQVCARCGGDEQCQACEGTRILKQKIKLSVRIPKQVEDGMLLRLRSRGHEALDGKSGDLIVQISVREHEKFKRVGYDLHCTEQISFTKAILGGPITIKTLEGERTMELQPGTAHNE